MANAVQQGFVAAVCISGHHGFSKQPVGAIRLIAGLGCEGDAHSGFTVKHRSRVAANPNQPNLRQVHLIHQELHDELRAIDFAVAPGSMGENITTQGIDLLGLPLGALLRCGQQALIAITGLRNPCKQLNAFQPGLMDAVLGRDADGCVILKSGIMGVVLQGGVLRAGDPICVSLPPEPRRRLERV